MPNMVFSFAPFSHNTDTAGQERFWTEPSCHFLGKDIIIVGYDVTERESLKNCDRWIALAREQSDDRAIFVAVGNKIDLKEERKVEKEEAVKFFEERGIPADHYFETSAKTGEGVNALFIGALSLWLKRIEEKNVNTEFYAQLPTPDNPPQKNCIIA